MSPYKIAISVATCMLCSISSTATAPVFASTARHVVNCSFAAEVPIRHPAMGTITAKGHISTCAPSDPDTCRLETGIQMWNRYLTEPRWATVGTSGPKYGPPCTGMSQKATTTCEHSTEKNRFRALTIIAAVEDGDSDVRSDYSSEESYFCIA